MVERDERESIHMKLRNSLPTAMSLDILPPELVIQILSFARPLDIISFRKVLYFLNLMPAFADRSQIPDLEARIHR